MSKRNIEPGWHEPVQHTTSDEWEEELNALHETVVRVVDGSETPISPHVNEIPNGRDGVPLDADDEVRSSTRNRPAGDDAPAADESEPPAIMRAFNSGAGFVKDNAAVAAATAAAGIGWLIWNSRSTPGPAPIPDVSKAIKDTASSAVDKVKDAGGSAVGSIKEVGGNAVEGAKSMTSGVLESVKSAGSNVAHTASSAVTNVAHTASSAVTNAAQSATSAVTDAAQKVGSTGKDQAKRVGTAALGVAKSSPIELALTILSAAWLYRSARPERSADSEPGKLGQLTDQAKSGSLTAIQAIEGMVQKNPLVAGGIALVIGAIVGLLIPESNVENRVMGQKHDELMDKAMDAAHEFTEDLTSKVKAVATEAVNTVKEEAKNQGLVAGGDNAEQTAPNNSGEIPADSPDADQSPANAI
ncbi:hypothetical protein CCAX7_53030 [Capsulimonas corticalis]|uniref:Uncharacterized protein n=1 Tax=Capsulimonas corticalis TaxID=2219043 RepID=A0A402CNZ4_9BACT|nr:YtxH domain-containing protein [Capsulimonas corticalis]BDI33252.1 hypothetical protein CCAX7_53030 [Capsulimonas corticalis]